MRQPPYAIEGDDAGRPGDRFRMRACEDEREARLYLLDIDRPRRTLRMLAVCRRGTEVYEVYVSHIEEVTDCSGHEDFVDLPPSELRLTVTSDYRDDKMLSNMRGSNVLIREE